MEADQRQNIRQRFQRVQERMADAARLVNRQPEEVRLVVVTKTHPLEIVKAVVEAGAKFLGENYADEAVTKIQEIKPQNHIQWHMIGHIQSRKASLVSEFFDYVHSLDRLKIALHLDQYAGKFHKILPVLLECNTSGEKTKSGWPIWDEAQWEQLLPELNQVAALTHLQVQGLMTMPPFFDQAEFARPYFQKLRRFQTFLSRHIPHVDWHELSMGMSADFEVAIQEGATWVRIGQEILGPRQAK
jgi:pyridoxal phosphate enzyme (YggS family)